MNVHKRVKRNRYTAFVLCLLLLISIVIPIFSTQSVNAEKEEKGMEPQGEERIVAYYTNWANYGRDFHVLDLDVSNITHILYAFGDFCWEGSDNRESPPSTNQCYDYVKSEEMPNGLVVMSDAWADIQNEGLVRLTEEEKAEWDVDYFGNLGAFYKLKKTNPHLKVLFSLGGWTLSKNFSNVTFDEEARATFVKSAVEFVRKYNLDGLDIDWEYPVGGGGAEGNSNRPEDKENHTKLLRELREELDKYEQEDGKKYELSIASSANPIYLENNEMDKIGEIVDFVNIMTYDFYVAREGVNGHNSPLFIDLTADIDGKALFNVETAIMGHLDAGIPPEKLVMGMAMYGRSWADCSGEYTACSGPSEGTWENGVVDYDHVMEKMSTSKSGYTRYWNNQAKVPYLLHENGEFISFDDVHSIEEKAKLAKEYGLGGAMFWELSQDRGQDLIRAAVNVFNDIDLNRTIDIGSSDLVEVYKGKIVTGIRSKNNIGFEMNLPVNLPNETKMRANELTITKKDSPKGYQLAGGAFNIEMVLPERLEDFFGEFHITFDVDRNAINPAIHKYNKEGRAWEVIGVDGVVNDNKITFTVNEMGLYAVFSEKESSTTSTVTKIVFISLFGLIILFVIVLNLYRRRINADDALL